MSSDLLSSSKNRTGWGLFIYLFYRELGKDSLIIVMAVKVDMDVWIDPLLGSAKAARNC